MKESADEAEETLAKFQKIVVFFIPSRKLKLDF